MYMIPDFMNINSQNRLFKSGYLWYILFCLLLVGFGTVPVSSAAVEVTSLSPDTGYAGFSYLVNMTGHSFSEGQTIGFSLDSSSLNVTGQKVLSDTLMTFRIVIPGDAKPGHYQMSITPPSGDVQRFNQMFLVQPPAAPHIENFTPSYAMAGTIIPATITGEYFRIGATAGMWIGEEQVNLTNLSASYDTISGTVMLPVTAKPGSWNITVTNPDGQEATLTGACIVTELPAPQIIGITPDQGDMDSDILVAVTGTNFLPGATFSLNRKDQTLSPSKVQVDSPGRLIGTVRIPQKYHEGLWDLVVTNPDGQSVRKTNAYLSGAPSAPLNLQISPVWGVQGNQYEVTIRGMAFLEGDQVTLQRGSSSIPAKNVTVISGTQVSSVISIPSDAEPGAYDVVVTSRYGKSDAQKSGFTIYDRNSLLLAGIEPDNGEQGQSLTAMIVGHNLQNGSQFRLRANGKEISGNSGTLVSPGRMSVQLHIPADAMPDIWDLILVSPSGKEITKTDAFRVLYNKTPVIDAIQPDRAPVGTNDLKITVTGTNFGDGEFINLNLTLNNTTIPVAGAASYKGNLITGYLTIPNGTAKGWYDLSVSRDAGFGKTASKSEMFRIL